MIETRERPDWVGAAKARIAYVDDEGVTRYSPVTPEDYDALFWDEQQVLSKRVACKRTPVAKLGPDGEMHFKPFFAKNLHFSKWVEQLEQNQGRWAKPCCRKPENHEIEAYYSSEDDQAKGAPDIYVFFCKCGCRHRKFVPGADHGYKTDHHGRIQYGPETVIYGKRGNAITVRNPVPMDMPRPKWEIR